MPRFRDEIPQRAFVNAEIIQCVMSGSALKFCIDKIKSKYSLESYGFYNQAYVVSLLYCLFVVPKELWLKSTHPFYSSVSESYLRKLFSVSECVKCKKKDEDFVHAFFRHLRNSIAHVRFDVDSDMKFTFWDQLNEKSEEKNFKCCASIKNIMLFLSEVGASLANLRSNQT